MAKQHPARSEMSQCHTCWKQSIWLRIALCGGYCRCQALRPSCMPETNEQTIKSITEFPHFFPEKIFHNFSMTSSDHFPWPRDVMQQFTIFNFCTITSTRNIKFHQLQAIHPNYKMDCQLTSEMSKYVNWKAKIQPLVLDIVISYSFNLTVKLLK